MSLYSYYPVLMLTDVISLMSAAIATVSDCLPPEHRAAGFAVTLGSFSAGLAIAPLFGQALGVRGAVAAALGFRGVGLLYTMVRSHPWLLCSIIFRRSKAASPAMCCTFERLGTLEKSNLICWPRLYDLVELCIEASGTYGCQQQMQADCPATMSQARNGGSTIDGQSRPSA